MIRLLSITCLKTAFLCSCVFLIPSGACAIRCYVCCIFPTGKSVLFLNCLFLPWWLMSIFHLFFIPGCPLAIKMVSHWLSVFTTFISCSQALKSQYLPEFHIKESGLNGVMTIGDGVPFSLVVNRASPRIKQSKACVCKHDHKLSLTFLPTYVRSFQYMLALIIFLLLQGCTMKVLSMSPSFNALYQMPGTSQKNLLHESRENLKGKHDLFNQH